MIRFSNLFSVIAYLLYFSIYPHILTAEVMTKKINIFSKNQFEIVSKIKYIDNDVNTDNWILLPNNYLFHDNNSNLKIYQIPTTVNYIEHKTLLTVKDSQVILSSYSFYIGEAFDGNDLWYKLSNFNGNKCSIISFDIREKISSPDIFNNIKINEEYFKREGLFWEKKDSVIWVSFEKKYGLNDVLCSVRILKKCKENLSFIQFLKDHRTENSYELLNEIIPDIKSNISNGNKEILDKM